MEPPTKRPSTLSKACETCKGRKTRCDSHRPQCGTCFKRGITCVYRERGQPGLRPGYGRAVERRLDQLEEMVRDLATSIRSAGPNLTADTGSAPDVEATETSATREISPTDRVSIRAGAGRELDTTGSPLPPGVEQQTLEIREENPSRNLPSGEREGSFEEGQLQIEFSNEVTPEGFAGSASVAPDQVTRPGEPLSSTDFSLRPGMASPYQQAQAPPREDLPPEDTLRELTELFFEFAYPCNQIFHKPAFLSGLFAPDRRILLHAITVVAFRFLDKPYPDIDAREQYVQHSRDRILLGAIGLPSLASTQALALIALDSFGCSPGSRTVSIMSLLAAAARQLGLVRHPANEFESSSVVLIREDSLVEHPACSYAEEEERRRLFWFIFMMDRFVSLYQGSKSLIPIDDIRQRLPCRDADWDRPTWSDPFRASGPSMPFVFDSTDRWRHLIEILTLLDRTHVFLLQPLDISLSACCREWQTRFRVLDLEVRTWYQYLPKSARERPAQFDPLWVMIQATFYAVVIRMHAIAAYPHATSVHFTGSSIAVDRGRQAVRSLVEVFQPLSDAEIDHLNPICAFIVWIASRNLIMSWTAGFGGADDPAVTQDLTALLDILHRAARRWQCAQRYADLIQLMIDKRHSAEEEGRLSVFNDTRRTAHGVCNLLGQLADENRIMRLDQVFNLIDMSFLDQFSVPTVS